MVETGATTDQGREMSVLYAFQQAEDGADRSARRIATAYESAILAVSLGQADLIPCRSIRAAMVEALLAEADRNPYDVDALTNAAIRAADGW